MGSMRKLVLLMHIAPNMIKAGSTSIASYELLAVEHHRNPQISESLVYPSGVHLL